MSFIKRSFSWGLIDNKKDHDFREFDNWIMKVDCCFCNDQLSADFISCYSQEEKAIRKILHSSLVENKTFVKDLISCIVKIRKIAKKNQEDPSIEKRIESFRKKWNERPEKYFKLKINNYGK